MITWTWHGFRKWHVVLWCRWRGHWRGGRNGGFRSLICCSPRDRARCGRCGDWIKRDARQHQLEMEI